MGVIVWTIVCVCFAFYSSPSRRRLCSPKGQQQRQTHSANSIADIRTQSKMHLHKPTESWMSAIRIARDTICFLLNDFIKQYQRPEYHFFGWVVILPFIHSRWPTKKLDGPVWSIKNNTRNLENWAVRIWLPVSQLSSNIWRHFVSSVVVIDAVNF
jgi:hypothetical protein